MEVAKNPIEPCWPLPDQATFLNFWSVELEKMGAEQILRWAVDTYRSRLAVMTSFGLSGSVLAAMLGEVDHEIPIYTIDSGYLHPETEELTERLQKRYDLNIITCSHELSVEEYEAENGGPLYHRDPDRCCRERKFDVFRKISPQFDALICGVRRDQNHSRAHTPVIEWDERLGLVRISPLVRWTRRTLWEKIRRESIPYNSLFDQGFSKIDCAPCCRPALSDEDDLMSF